MSNDLSVRSEVAIHRTWASNPLSIYDRPVEIWFNQKWVPAYFSDIKKGDFYLDLNLNLEPGRCFCAASNAMAYKASSGLSFIIPNGSEIVQAPVTSSSGEPKLIDINPAPKLIK